MPRPPRVWTSPLTDVDRIQIRLVTSGREVIEFSAQYEILYKGHWRKVVRFDNAHGKPHKHNFYPNGKTLKQYMQVLDNNDAFTEALLVIRSNFSLFRENYILIIERVGGGES